MCVRARACAGLNVNVRGNSRAMCSTLRPAGATVHDEARRGPPLRCECCVGGCLPHHWSADSKRRRHINRRQELGEGGAPASPPPRTVRAPPTVARLALACACTQGAVQWSAVRFGRLCGAAQRYPLLFSALTYAPRSSSSAILSDAPLNAASCSAVSLHGRRAGTRPPHSADAEAEAERRARGWSWR